MSSEVGGPQGPEDWREGPRKVQNTSVRSGFDRSRMCSRVIAPGTPRRHAPALGTRKFNGSNVDASDSPEGQKINWTPNPDFLRGAMARKLPLKYPYRVMPIDILVLWVPQAFTRSCRQIWKARNNSSSRLMIISEISVLRLRLGSLRDIDAVWNPLGILMHDPVKTGRAGVTSSDITLARAI
ncbi:hypothetical protein BD779DRAFT_1791068 [Infundibulicybe gibba]|nr:hypothetical protein BD779DRAFT_1791068 [Infundibulicybe gibba]